MSRSSTRFVTCQAEEWVVNRGLASPYLTFNWPNHKVAISRGLTVASTGHWVARGSHQGDMHHVPTS